MREDALRNERSELFYAEKKELEKGLRKDSRKGKLIGQIHAAQHFLKRKITPEKKLLEQSMKDLRAILKTLESELEI